jgi:hypothetical protein
MQNHQCEQGQKVWEERKKSPRTYKYRLCNEAIYYDNEHMTENEKHIPVEVLTDKVHNCPKYIKKYCKHRVF